MLKKLEVTPEKPSQPTRQEIHELKQIALTLPKMPVPVFEEEFEYVPGKEYKEMLEGQEVQPTDIIEDNMYPIPVVSELALVDYNGHLANLTAFFTEKGIDGVQEYVDSVYARIKQANKIYGNEN